MFEAIVALAVVVIFGFLVSLTFPSRKKPDPITPAQLQFILSLHKQLKIEPPPPAALEAMTKLEASGMIDRLLDEKDAR